MQAASDLELNPLFRALQTEFAKQFRWVQQKCGIVCIPHSLTIFGVKIDDNFIKMHVFRPSPFLKDHYITQDETCTVCFEDDYVLTGDGFPNPPKKAKVLTQELGYNEKSEKFYLLLIDRPLVGEVQKQVDYDEWMVSTVNLWTLELSKKFLAHFSECSEALKVLDVELNRFKSSYIVLPDYLSDAASKLRTIWTNVAQLYRSLLRKPINSDPIISENIDVALECCVVSSVHSIVWSAVSKKCGANDISLATKCQQLSNISPSQMSLPTRLDSCNFSRAVHLLEGLDNCACPREKLTCLKSVLDALTETVANHHDAIAADETSSSLSPQKFYLTSDDYISLLVIIIVRQKGCHLASNLFYLDTFLLFNKHADNLSYCLVTFKATYEFILSLPVGQLSKHHLQQLTGGASHNVVQCSSSAAATSTVAAAACGVDTTSSYHQSRVDLELDRINRSLASAAVDDKYATSSSSTATGWQHDIAVTSWNSDQPSQCKAKRNSSQLGDFLSSLKNDSFRTAYGKQT